MLKHLVGKAQSLGAVTIETWVDCILVSQDLDYYLSIFKRIPKTTLIELGYPSILTELSHTLVLLC